MQVRKEGDSSVMVHSARDEASRLRASVADLRRQLSELSAEAAAREAKLREGLEAKRTKKRKWKAAAEAGTEALFEATANHAAEADRTRLKHQEE
eukprot:323674-Pyramimonas_sp.AAC.1